MADKERVTLAVNLSAEQLAKIKAACNGTSPGAWARRLLLQHAENVAEVDAMPVPPEIDLADVDENGLLRSTPAPERGDLAREVRELRALVEENGLWLQMIYGELAAQVSWLSPEAERAATERAAPKLNAMRRLVRLATERAT